MSTQIGQNTHDSQHESSKQHHKIICPKPVKVLIPKNPFLRDFIENASEPEDLRAQAVTWSPSHITKIKVASALRSSSPSYSCEENTVSTSTSSLSGSPGRTSLTNQDKYLECEELPSRSSNPLVRDDHFQFCDFSNSVDAQTQFSDTYYKL